MDTLAMELCPGTAKYRQSRLLWWHSMRYLYEDYVDDAMKHGSPLVAAEDAASKNQRGQTRALISELLTQAPVFSIVAFLAIVGDVSDPATPFKHSKAVDDLIESMYPRRPWATKTVKFAGGADDARWSAWLTGWAEEFAATGTEARDAMTPPGRAGGGLGLAAGFTTLLRWAPYIIAGSGLTQRFLNEHERQHLEDRRTVTMQGANYTTNEEIPKALRTLVSIGSLVQDVVADADKNARERLGRGEQPDLIGDLLKGANTHIPKIEDLVGEFAGRTSAKTMVDFLLSTHSVLGAIKNYPHTAQPSSGQANARPEFTSAAEQAAAAAANTSGQQTEPRFRPEFTTAAGNPATNPANASPPPPAAEGPTGERATSSPPRRLVVALLKDLAVHINGFEAGVATEQADLRDRIHRTISEVAALRADLRSVEMTIAERVRQRAEQQADLIDPTDETAKHAPAVELPSPTQEADAEPQSEDTGGEQSEETVSEEDALLIVNMLTTSQQRVCASLESDRGLMAALEGEVLELREKLSHLQASA